MTEVIDLLGEDHGPGRIVIDLCGEDIEDLCSEIDLCSESEGEIDLCGESEGESEGKDNEIFEENVVAEYCTICLFDISKDPQSGMACVPMVLGCGHSFHDNCVLQWIANGPVYTPPNCPICRHNI